MTIVRDFAENIQSDGDLIVSGDLQVSGTTTTVNSTTVEIGDKNIVLGATATANSQNDGGGISILLPDASPDEFATFTHTGTTWNLNDSLSLDDGNLIVNGEITSSIYNISSDSEHVLAFGTVSSISGATVDTTTLRGRQLDLYAYDDVFIRAGTSNSIRLWSGGDATLTLDDSNNATFEGTIAAPSGNVFVGKSDATLGTDGTNIANTSTIISASSGNTYHVYNTNTSTYPFVVSFDGNVTAGNVSADYSRLGRGFRTADRGELLLHSTAATDTSEIFFGFGDGHPGNDSNYRWTISDRGTADKSLKFYASPAVTGSNFDPVLDLDYDNLRIIMNKDLVLTNIDAAFPAITAGTSTQTQYTNIVLQSDSGDAQIWKAGSLYTNYSGASSLNIYNNNGVISFHPQAVVEVLKLSSTAATFGRPIIVQYSSNTSATADGTTLLSLNNYVGGDLTQQKSFIDFSFTDDNSNELPQVRIGAEVGENGDANTQSLEGSGAFVVYTNDATTEGSPSTAATALSEKFRVDFEGTATFAGRLNIGGQLNLGGPIIETADIIGTAAASYNIDVLDNSVRFVTADATANWSFNIRGSSSTTLNSVLGTGDSTTVVFLATNGTTPYYNTSLTIDGVAQTVKWQLGSAPTAGNASSIDVYTFTIFKTAASTYTVLGNQAQFA